VGPGGSPESGDVSGLLVASVCELVSRGE
jgi:hypothetical protein